MVTDPTQRKCGIVASSYKSFLKKCREKFKLKKQEEIIIALEDKTEVDDEYFEFLSNGTRLFIFKAQDFDTADNIHHLASFLQECLKRQPQLHTKVMACLQDEITSKRAATLLELMAKVMDSSIPLTSKEGHAEWFKGLDTRFKTKEAVMRNSAETRMRGYLDHTKRELLSEQLPADSPQHEAILYFKKELCKTRYNGSYFDRLAPPGENLCDSTGLFQCEGPYNECRCSGLHFINPYASREARIIFSTWNFDHVIEKSRTIIPKLKAALSGPGALSVNLSYFHDLLFCHKSSQGINSDGNLKLVHIACHVKKPHECHCKPEKIFLDKQHDNVDGPCQEQNHQLTRRGVKRARLGSGYFTRSKRMQVLC